MQFKTLKYFSMAVLALAVAACGNDDIDLSPDQQPSEGIPFTATIATGSSAMTRALSGPDAEGKITASWEANEKVALIYTVGETKYNTTATVSSVDGNGKATITATLQDGVTDDTDVTLIYPASAADGTTGNVKSDLLLNQDGTLDGIASKYDVRTGTGKIAVSGSSSSLKEDVTLNNQYAIWKMTLNNSAQNLYITADGVQIAGATLATAGTAFCVAVPAVSSQTISVVALDESNNCYYFSKASVSITASKFYQSDISSSMTTLGTDTSADIYKITGSSSASIPNGKTAVLSGVNISGGSITCKGSATIILVGENTVTGGYGPGIRAGESNEYFESTLTITGTGSLEATGSENNAGIGSENNGSCGNITISGGTVTAQGGNNGAGIGTGYVDKVHRSSSCGDITISGGTVMATGGKYAAGIGTGHVGGLVTSSSCGTITISGGTVTATGGEWAAGIGTGYVYGKSMSATCGAITITTDVTEVTATKGDDACCIGKGYGGGTFTIGTITIGGAVYWNGSDYQNDGGNYLTNSPLIYQP